MVSLVNFKIVDEDLWHCDDRCTSKEQRLTESESDRFCAKRDDATGGNRTHKRELRNDYSNQIKKKQKQKQTDDRTSFNRPAAAAAAEAATEASGQVAIKMTTGQDCPRSKVNNKEEEEDEEEAHNKQQETMNFSGNNLKMSSNNNNDNNNNNNNESGADLGHRSTYVSKGDDGSSSCLNENCCCSRALPVNEADKLNDQQIVSGDKENYSCDDTSQCSLSHEHESSKITGGGGGGGGDGSATTSQNGCSSFTVTWRNLKFCIEPKWHQKLANCSPYVALTSRVRACSSSSSLSQSIVAQQSACEPQKAAAAAAAAAPPKTATAMVGCHDTREPMPAFIGAGSPQTSRIVLDRLDGSFKSGELTAILGPSGAGKTTLLDCLTGHRKSGLSGSIRISSSVFQSDKSCTCKTEGNSAGKTSNRLLLQNLHNNFHPHELAARDNKKGTNKLILSSSSASCPSSPMTTANTTTTSTATTTVTTTATTAIEPRCGHCERGGVRKQMQILNSTSSHIISGDNLKVSIIPQNDHIIGHLTVFETLNYASKMKNCFNRQFDHKLNVKRVAQQLGLMSCLTTRINKLSGGQYKRVSIAQELLSSPDILILDEPTSGLDAMTCFQTVQTLKKLTDEQQETTTTTATTTATTTTLPISCARRKPIAVILTIHQPNSDVFQQFNHVYVVAQGGKCIYEGPPASIESVINRIGICLPNSYYNPATMIVEIAAGKFGQEAICKLNSIQKKQYERLCVTADEQNSTGDSAVDCPSSSNEEEDDYADDHDDGNGATDDNCDNNNDNDDDDQDSGADDDELQHSDACCCDTATTTTTTPATTLTTSGHETRLVKSRRVVTSRLKLRARPLPDHQEVNNNSSNICDKVGGGGGLINKGFTMDCGKSLAAESGDKICSNIKPHDCGESVVVIVPDEPIASANYCADNKIGCPQSEIQQQQQQQLQPRRNRKRRRTRRRADNKSEILSQRKQCPSTIGLFVCANLGATAGGPAGGDGDGSGSDAGGGGGAGRGEKRLKLNSLKADQKFPFWRHTYLHFHRSWLSIVRDPMLCSMQLALHIIVPVMVSLVYGTYVGKPNACPRYGPIDIMAYALEPTDKALQLQEDLRTTLENIGYIFFKLYGVIFAAMTVTVLTFPLDMHVLVKEFRNGWYGLSSYFLGRTLADIPFQLTLPLLAMSLSYYATGQPYSYMQWRFFSITAILILSSLIAQSQGLLFGAILMDRMKAAVFVAPAATTPIILFAGFLVRTQSIPSYLRPLSNLSYLRYAIEGCLISRYGFNQCECDPAIFNQTVPELPPIARSMLDYWLSSFKLQQTSSEGGGGGGSDLLEATSLSLHNNNSTILETTSTSTSTSAATALTESQDKPDLFGKLIDSLARANSFGRNITSCEQVVPYPMIDYDLNDSQLFSCFAILLAMLIFTRLLTFFIVCYKVKRKV